MGQRNISGPVAAAFIVVVAALFVFFGYRTITGGTVGDGRAGNVEASPPMPNAARQEMLNTARGVRQGGSIRP